jgi:DNA integrity scanning protein DisA with diadenylate cyclase activity
MWKWQHQFQSVVLELLTDILNVLKVRLRIDAFIIGIPLSGSSLDSICFYPEDCGYFTQEFKTVFSIANDNYENDPNRHVFHTADFLQEAHQDSLYPKALKKAVESILNNHHAAIRLVSFCSVPVQINCHWVMIIIQIEKEEWDRTYRLTKAIYKQNEYRNYRLNRSFLEAIVYEVFSIGISELQSPSQGNCWKLAKTERILEDAALNLLLSVKTHVNTWGGGNLLELANAVSAERYEGLGSKGRLVICHKNNPHISIKINLKNPIPINNYRGIRKLVEISSEAMALLCDGNKVWGLGSPLDSYDPCREDLFEIKFTDHYTWELIHDNHVMLNVKYRQPKLPIKRFDELLFLDHINRFFNVDDKEILTILVEAVEAAVEQLHGTMLVISSQAEAEAERLGAQSTAIDPIPVSRDIISHISSIDGAILISPDGIVHSFGVILDGLASENGDPSRGARYNSAIRYVDGQKNCQINCLALIVSEDGYVTLYPTLRPRISRLTIDKLIEDIEICIANDSQPFNYEKARSSMWNLEKLSFYLLEKDISLVNRAKNIIVECMKGSLSADMAQTGIGFIISSYDDFTIDEEMNDEYYL